MYSYEERKKAVDLYIKYGKKATAVITELGKEGAFIDGLYFCPHHTDKGFPGIRVRLN